MKKILTILMLLFSLTLIAVNTHSYDMANCVGYWSLNENSLNSAQAFTDLSGNGNLGTSANVPTFSADQSGVGSQAMVFNGSSDYVDLDSSILDVSSLSEGTIGINFKTIDKSTTVLFSASDKSDASSDLAISISASGYLLYSVRENGSNILIQSYNIDLADGYWHNVFITSDASGTKIYLDNVNVMASGTQAFFANVNDIDEIRIANRVDSGGNEYYYDGSLSDILIYNTALTSDQVSKLYEAGRSTATVEMDGRELVTNGEFDTDSDWEKQTGWTISGGKAVCATTSYFILYQSAIQIIGNKYKATFTISDYVSGGVCIDKRNSQGATVFNADGTFEYTYISVSTRFSIYGIDATVSSLKLDNVSVIDITNSITYPTTSGNLVLDMPLCAPYVAGWDGSNYLTTKDLSYSQADGTVSGATIQYDGLANVSAGIAYVPSDVAYGEWEFDVNKGADGNASKIYFVLSGNDKDTSSGYRVGISSAEQITFFRNDVGNETNLFQSVASYVNIDTDYRIKVTRTEANVFTVYIKGGAFGWDSWTTVVADSGTNPVIDNTYTSNSYFVADLDADDVISDLYINGEPVLLSTATQVSPGVFTTTAPSYDFNGTTDYIDLGADEPTDLTGDITISCWIRPESLGEGNSGRIITNEKLFFSMSSTNTLNLRLFSGISGAADSGENSISLNTWQHALVTRKDNGDGTSYANIYIDGVLSGDANQNTGQPIAGTTNTFIGNRLANDRTFDGQIKGMKIRQGIATTAEITYEYNTSWRR